MIETIQWLGHGSFVIQAQQTIYINPRRIARNAPPADVILIGHDHYEHFSIIDIENLSTANTQIITNDNVANQLNQSVTVLRPWQSISLDRTSIKAVPAYSPSSFEHPLKDGGLGFVISMNFYDIYYAGDTQITPDMERIHPDVAILPIDGSGTLSLEDAVVAVEMMRPRWVIPSNWGKQIGGATPLDVLRFRDMVGDRAEVIVPMSTTHHR